jgi:hypothetical protein
MSEPFSDYELIAVKRWRQWPGEEVDVAVLLDRAIATIDHMAGSATSTEWQCEFCQGRGDHPDFVRHAHSCHALDPTFRRVTSAGSATPDGDDHG